MPVLPSTQHAVELNIAGASSLEGAAATTVSPRRTLSELQEGILEHISALSTAVAGTIREWNALPMSPKGSLADDRIASLRTQTMTLSAAFQRTLGSSGAGWANPVPQVHYR